MATALTVYGIQTASSTLSTANQLVTTTGGTQSLAKTTLLGNQTGYIEVWSQGNAASQTTGTGVAAPNGHGWLYDSTVLEGQDIVAGNWQFIVTCDKSNVTGALTASLILAIYKRSSGGTYTSIGTITLTGQSLSGSPAAFTSALTALSVMSFTTGDKLYVERWDDVTAGTTTSTSTLNEGQSSTANGIANNMQIITPGYQPTVTLTNNNMSAEDDLVVTDSPFFVESDIPVILLNGSDLQSALQAWNVESLSAGDSVLFGSVTLPFDFLVVADTFFIQYGWLSTDTLSVTPTFNVSDGVAFLDALFLSDVFVDTLMSVFVDALTGSDIMGVTEGNFFVDSMNIAVLVGVGETYLALDSASVGDTTSAIQAWTVDILPAVDSTVWQENALIVDAIPAQDIFSTLYAYTTSDALAVQSVSLLLDSFFAPANLVSLQDAFAGSIDALLLDILSVQDTLLHFTSSSADESLSVQSVSLSFDVFVTATIIASLQDLFAGVGNLVPLDVVPAQASILQGDVFSTSDNVVIQSISLASDVLLGLTSLASQSSIEYQVATLFSSDLSESTALLAELVSLFVEAFSLQENSLFAEKYILPVALLPIHDTAFNQLSSSWLENLVGNSLVGSSDAYSSSATTLVLGDVAIWQWDAIWSENLSVSDITQIQCLSNLSETLLILESLLDIALYQSFIDALVANDTGSSLTQESNMASEDDLIVTVTFFAQGIDTFTEANILAVLTLMNQQTALQERLTFVSDSLANQDVLLPVETLASNTTSLMTEQYTPVVDDLQSIDDVSFGSTLDPIEIMPLTDVFTQDSITTTDDVLSLTDTIALVLAAFYRDSISSDATFVGGNEGISSISVVLSDVLQLENVYLPVDTLQPLTVAGLQQWGVAALLPTATLLTYDQANNPSEILPVIETSVYFLEGAVSNVIPATTALFVLLLPLLSEDIPVQVILLSVLESAFFVDAGQIASSTVLTNNGLWTETLPPVVTVFFTLMPQLVEVVALTEIVLLMPMYATVEILTVLDASVGSPTWVPVDTLLPSVNLASNEDYLPVEVLSTVEQLFTQTGYSASPLLLSILALQSALQAWNIDTLLVATRFVGFSTNVLNATVLLRSGGIAITMRDGLLNALLRDGQESTIVR